MTNHVEGKVIIITGAASGFGRIASTMAAQKGGKVICADINEEGLKTVVAEIKEGKGEAEYIVTNVADKEQVDAMAAFAKKTFGRIDVLVNNAGTMPLAYLSNHEKAWKAWDLCIDTNIKGTLYGIAAVYDTMIEQQQGQIVNIASILSHFPSVGAAAYGASKQAVYYITETLRQEAKGVIKTSLVTPTGVGNTGLAKTIIDYNEAHGAYGRNADEFYALLGKLRKGEAPDGVVDKDSIKYMNLDATFIAEAIIHVIDQPWGVSVSDVTVRCSGDFSYV